MVDGSTIYKSHLRMALKQTKPIGLVKKRVLNIKQENEYE